MFYYIYQITNNVNGKIYVGVHKTKDMNDGYMGSGKIIKAAIEKYGIGNFTKAILETFDNAEAMYATEKELVTEEFLAREDVYNLRRGGTGGFDYINTHGLSYGGVDGRSKGGHVGGKRTGPINGKISVENKTGIHSGDFYGFKSSEHQKNMVLNAQTQQSREKRKITRQNNKFQQNENNSQYGTVCIRHDIFGFKRCKKDLLPEYIDQGWIQGWLGLRAKTT